jgi:hypothetical protein
MKQLLCAAAIFLFTASRAFAAHPLITDDAGTVGKNKVQVELNSEYSYDKQDGVKTKTTEVAATLTYGILGNLDIVLGAPYQWIRVKDPETSTHVNGIGDMTLEAKWRFLEYEGFSLAVKPGLIFPTGKEEDGLGSGRVGYSVYLITTKELKPFAFHLNLGYIRNENKGEDEKNIWHASLAGEVEVVKDLKAVANIGIERNPVRDSNVHPAFILGGLIYTISEHVDVDLGIKGGLTKPEVDYAILGGLTFHF